MSDEKKSVSGERIGLVIAIVTIAVNIGALILNYDQTGKQIAESRSLADKQIAESRSLSNKQIAETRSLTVLTKELDDRVNRLAASLDQRVSRLNRLNELLKAIYVSHTRILQKAKVLSEIYGSRTLSTETYLEYFTVDELAEREVTKHWSLVEMAAIAEVVADPDLLEAFTEFTNNFPKSPTEVPPDEFIGSYNKFLDSAKKLHHKIYALLKESADAPKL